MSQQIVSKVQISIIIAHKYFEHNVQRAFSHVQNFSRLLLKPDFYQMA